MLAALTVLAVAFVSAFFPPASIEAYLAGVTGVAGPASLAYAAAAAVGQVGGKLVVYEVSRSSHHWGWLQRRLSRPRIADRLERMEDWIRQHRSLAGLVLLASSTVGVPPLLIMTVLVGRLRLPRALFLVTTLLGRFGRFLALTGVMTWAWAAIA